MRHHILLRSIEPFLQPGERLFDAAFMWARHRFSYFYALAGCVALLGFTTVLGFSEWPSRLALAVVGGAVAMTATTMYRVLASTSDGLVLLEGGKVRQVAKRRLRTLDPGSVVEIQRDTLITTDWKVGGAEFTVPKGSQRAMERIAAITRSAASSD